MKCDQCKNEARYLSRSGQCLCGLCSMPIAKDVILMSQVPWLVEAQAMIEGAHRDVDKMAHRMISNALVNFDAWKENIKS